MSFVVSHFEAHSGLASSRALLTIDYADDTACKKTMMAGTFNEMILANDEHIFKSNMRAHEIAVLYSKEKKVLVHSHELHVWMQHACIRRLYIAIALFSIKHMSV